MEDTILTIRKASREDLADLLDLARTAFLQAFSAGNKSENVQAYLNEAFTLEQLEKELDEPASIFFVAEKAKEIIGYTKVNLVPAQTDVHDPESLEIARLYVLEEHLGSGLGKWLLDTAIDFAKQNQKKYLWLGVWEHNARAIRFYEKNGLRIFGSHPFPFGDEIQTDYLMRVDF
ncbi:GNAT family N-acetyltransferase [Algoriphagus boritolerans]|uniref:Ribosomal protein S18 acetylase RimI n=1 Tax=Algoriphagus boritolerans DSM 17298 = JCM 18970 TaxID=1120964 RepID=A0A1H5X5H4_9BACT|nr:GNAT family N-acetyltransferase [Algoriphagus boritolerans]SEG07012.1 Ribosomal protein S18 acetylase RimI [Algoriphagus boritolerans DSM 17298 = JCM 18970]